MKKCKGIGRAKAHPGCGEPSEKRRYGLCHYCFIDWVKNTDEGEEWVKSRLLPKAKAKAKASIAKQERKAKKSFINYSGKLQSKIQELARLIDIGLPCLARGIHPNQMHGGHVFSKGHNKTIAFNLHNIHRQSAQSNHFGNDDGIFRDGLVKEYGLSYFEFISELRQCPPIKLTNDEYKKKYQLASKLARDLRANGYVSKSPEERIEMRNAINKLLNIYSEKYSVYDGKD
jgi:hypothetical protein